MSNALPNDLPEFTPEQEAALLEVFPKYREEKDPLTALRLVTDTLGLSVEDAAINLAINAGEEAVRTSFGGLLVIMLRNADVVLPDGRTLGALALFAIEQTGDMTFQGVN